MESLQDLFSDAVSSVDTRESILDQSLLWPEEAALIGDVVEGRRWDWVMGRRCARQAIEGLGIEPVAVLTGSKREPVWPTGIVGSITHTSGYAAAAVARHHEVFGVGLDAEPDEPLPRGVLRRVAVEAERDWLASGADLGVSNPDRLLFCIKEAIYKAWYPLAQRWLGFEDAQITVDPGRRSFEAEILVDGPLSTVTGRYGLLGGVLLAVVELRAEL